MLNCAHRRAISAPIAPKPRTATVRPASCVPTAGGRFHVRWTICWRWAMCRCRANINIAPRTYSARSTTCVPRLFVIAIPRAARPAIGRRSTPAPAQCTHRSLGVRARYSPGNSHPQNTSASPMRSATASRRGAATSSIRVSTARIADSLSGEARRTHTTAQRDVSLMGMQSLRYACAHPCNRRTPLTTGRSTRRPLTMMKRER